MFNGCHRCRTNCYRLLEVGLWLPKDCHLVVRRLEEDLLEVRAFLLEEVNLVLGERLGREDRVFHLEVVSPVGHRDRWD